MLHFRLIYCSIITSFYRVVHTRSHLCAHPERRLCRHKLNSFFPDRKIFKELFSKKFLVIFPEFLAEAVFFPLPNTLPPHAKGHLKTKINRLFSNPTFPHKKKRSLSLSDCNRKHIVLYYFIIMAVNSSVKTGYLHRLPVK